MFTKYSKEIVSIFIGLIVLGVFLAISYQVKKESKESKDIRAKEIQELIAEKENTQNQLENANKSAKILGVVEEVVPESFSSYIVFVKVDLKEPTDTEKAIENIEKACSIIGSAPLVLKTEIIGVQGRVFNDKGTEKLFDLDID